jgi:hypothetical protein
MSRVVRRRRRSGLDLFHIIEHYALRAGATIIIVAWVVKHVIEDLQRLFR